MTHTRNGSALTRVVTSAPALSHTRGGDELPDITDTQRKRDRLERGMVASPNGGGASDQFGIQRMEGRVRL